MTLTDVFRARTRPVAAARAWFDDLPQPARVLGVVLLIAAIYMAPHWPDVPVLGWVVDTPGANFANVLTDQIMIFILVACGLNVVVGLAGLLDLGYVGFYAVGAYTCAVMTSGHWNAPWLVSLPVAVVVTMIAGVVLGTPTLQIGRAHV